jgi:hypothetical protein
MPKEKKRQTLARKSYTGLRKMIGQVIYIRVSDRK